MVTETFRFQIGEESNCNIIDTIDDQEINISEPTETPIEKKYGFSIPTLTLGNTKNNDIEISPHFCAITAWTETLRGKFQRNLFG